MTGAIARLFVALGIQGGDNVKNELRGIKGELGGVSQAANFVKGALGALGISMSARAVYQFAEMGAKSLEVRDSFQELARQAGQSGDQLLDSLRRASGGTIAQNDLILASNRAMMLGLKTDTETMGDMMEVARFRARAMGIDTTQAFNDIVTGLGRNSPLILDNLGLVFDAKKEYEDFARSIGKTADALSEAEKKWALQSAAIRVGKEQIEKAGGLANNEADNFRIFEAAIADAKTEMQKLIAEWKIWNLLAKAARDAADSARETAAMSDLIEAYDKQIKAAAEAGKITGQQKTALYALMSAYSETAGSVEEFQERMVKAMAAEGIRGPLEAYLNAVTRVTNEAEAEWRSYIDSLSGLYVPDTYFDMEESRSAPWVGAYSVATSYYKEHVVPAIEDRKEREKEAAREAQRAWESAYRQMESDIRGLIRPTQSFDFRGQMDAMGMHIDTWDEDARRMMDVVNRGTESPWASFFEIPEDVKAKGEGEVKAWAAQQVKAYYEGRSTAGMSYNVEDIVSQYKDMAAQKELQDRLTKEAMGQLAAEGITVDASIMAQATGTMDYTAMAAGISGGFSKAWGDQDIWAIVGQMSEDQRKALEESGKTAGKTVANGILLAWDEIGFATELAHRVAPEVARILTPPGGGYQE